MSRRLNEQIEIEGKDQRREQDTLMVTSKVELCRIGMTEARMILYWVAMARNQYAILIPDPRALGLG